MRDEKYTRFAKKYLHLHVKINHGKISKIFGVQCNIHYTCTFECSFCKFPLVSAVDSDFSELLLRMGIQKVKNIDCITYWEEFICLFLFGVQV